MRHQEVKGEKKIATMKDNLVPSKELLDKVRHIAGYQLLFSSEMAKSLGEEGQLRSYLGDQLRSMLYQSDMQVSLTESPQISSDKHRLAYTVAESGVTYLEFADSIYDGGNEVSRTLESVHRYQQGDWEQKLNRAYEKCLHLRGEWEEVLALMKQLSSVSHSPGVIPKLIEETKDPAQIIKLLALSPNCETMCEPLFGIYLSVGKVKEAKLVIEILIQTYPKEAMYHVTLGDMFFGALYNARKSRADAIPSLRQVIDATGQAGAETLEMLQRVDPPLYKTLANKKYESSSCEASANQITLEALGCSYKLARDIAEREFMEAMRLSPDERLKQQVKHQLVTLRMMDKTQQAVTCPKCGSHSNEGQQFCGTCGGRLTIDCSSCGARVDPGAGFCTNCGTRLIGIS